jgi:hypothetical protein
MAQGNCTHADHRFLNELLNSSYVACLSDPDSSLEESNLGAMIVAAHNGLPTMQDTIVESTVDGILAEAGDNDIKTTLEKLDRLPAAQAGPQLSFRGNADQAAVDKLAGAEPIPAPRTYEETELELLQIGVLNPDLYNNMRKVFAEHKCPEKLDAVGQQIREFFVNQKG